jgi:CBS domain-containing protein
MMSMLVKVLDEASEPDKEPKEKQLSAKERLKQIVRGGGTLVGVVTANDEERNYVPSRPQPSYRTVLMIGRNDADASEYKPVRREQTEVNDVSTKGKSRYKVYSRS